MLAHPAVHRFVGGAGGDVVLELVGVDASGAEEAFIEGTIELKLAVHADEGRAAFVEGAEAAFESAQFVIGGARLFHAQVNRLFSNGVQMLWVHT